MKPILLCLVFASLALAGAGPIRNEKGIEQDEGPSVASSSQIPSAEFEEDDSQVRYVRPPGVPVECHKGPIDWTGKPLVVCTYD